VAKQRNALRAGIFMLISLALIIFIIIAISGSAKFTESFTTYPVAFALNDDIGGLRPGDDVRVGGLKVGTVHDIHVDLNREVIVVDIELPSKYVLNKDTGIFVQHGLTGSAAINIDSFGKGPVLAAGDYLAGQPDQLTGLMHTLASLKPDIRTVVMNIETASVKLNTDLDKIGATADSFTATGMSAESTVQNLRVRVPEIIDRYESVVDSARNMLDAIRDFFGPPSHDFRQTVANLNHVTGNLRDRVPDILDQIHGLLGNVNVAVDRANSALKEIQAAGTNLHSASASLRSLLTDNRSKLDGIIASLKTTADNLKDATFEIRHSPWRLLYQPKPGEVANLNIYDSVRQFAEGAGSLDDAASALRDALKDPNADPAQVKRLMQHLNDSFAAFQQVQNKLWNDIKE
jgi:phospholipid/cholesterol/gamma-HCH transport system substrate-binding protein